MIEPKNADLSAAMRLTDLTKAFGPTVALDGVSMQIERGHTHAILGENGAGKSTLVRIVTGVLRPDRGSLEVLGQSLDLGSPRDARRHGIASAFQELSLVPDLTVAQNLFLGYEPTGPGPLVLPRDLKVHADRLLASVDMEGVSPDSLVRDLRLADKQMLEVAKALRGDPEIVLLDEPTSALGQNGMDWFYGLVSKLQSRGVTIVFITHRLAEIRVVCRRVTILRNGRVVGTHDVGEVPESELIRLMIGRSLQATFPPRRPSSERPVVLETRGLTVGSSLVECGIQLRKGEILGVAGLAGHGHLELFLALFGIARPDKGEVLVEGRPVVINHPQDAVAAGIGISLVPEDRKTEGLFLRLSVRLNLAIPSLGSLSRYGWINNGALGREAATAANRVNVAHDALDAEVSSLSGGNQQKVVIGKWVLAGSKILLLYDPTRGVDIGTKTEIYRLMQNLAEQGVSIVFYSTELSEVTHLADRVLVFYRSRVEAELDGLAISDEAVMAAALGRSGGALNG
jgi:ribose transport system ATP-binding protein